MVEAVWGRLLSSTRHEQRDPLLLLRVDEAVAHAEALGDLGDGALERVLVGLELGQIEANALEEHRNGAVGVLVGVEDVRPVPVEHLRERGDDATTVGARDEERR